MQRHYALCNKPLNSHLPKLQMQTHLALILKPRNGCEIIFGEYTGGECVSTLELKNKVCKTPAVVFSLGKEKSKGASTAAPAAHAAVRCCRAGRQPGGADSRLAAAGLSPKAIEASTELVADGPDLGWP